MIVTLLAGRSRDIVYGETDFEIIDDHIIGKSRWANQHSVVVRAPKGGLMRTTYFEGSTESQEEQPFQDCEDVDWVIVKEVNKTVTLYEPVGGYEYVKSDVTDELWGEQEKES